MKTEGLEVGRTGIWEGKTKDGPHLVVGGVQGHFFKSLEQHNNIVSFKNHILQTKWGPSHLPHCSRNPSDGSFSSNSYLLQCPLKG